MFCRTEQLLEGVVPCTLDRAVQIRPMVVVLCSWALCYHSVPLHPGL